MTTANIERIIHDLIELGDPAHKEVLTKFGIDNSLALGVKMPILRAYVKAHQLKHQHTLAIALWEEPYHEAKLIAPLVDDPQLVTEEQMEKWASDFYSWDIVDNCMGLFAFTPYAHAKALTWINRPEEFVKRAGFVIIVTLAVHDKEAPDSYFIDFIPHIKEAACDERNYVKKAVNWALRQIGKRNLNLHTHAVEAALDIQHISCKTAKWIASNALRELRSEKIIQRLNSRHSV